MKRLDKLTQEEARMATAEVLKITHSVDGNMKVLIDGAQSEFSSNACNPDGLLCQMTNRQERSCNKRSSTNGFLPRIPPSIITLPAKLITRGRLLGSFRVLLSRNGNRLLRFYGYMANVRSLRSPVHPTPLRFAPL